MVLLLTGQRHPQLPPQRLRDPHGDQPLRLLRAEHVDAAAELGEVLLPQLLPQLLGALEQPPQAHHSLITVPDHYQRVWDSAAHLGAVGLGLLQVEGRHEGLAVDRVAQRLLLQLLLVRQARVVVEGVVGQRGALRRKEIITPVPGSRHCWTVLASNRLHLPPMTHHALLAALLAAEHGAPPLHGAQAHVEALHQLLPVLQLDELEGLLGAHADDDRVGQQVGALRLFDGQHLWAGGGVVYQCCSKQWWKVSLCKQHQSHEVEVEWKCLTRNQQETLSLQEPGKKKKKNICGPFHRARMRLIQLNSG